MSLPWGFGDQNVDLLGHDPQGSFSREATQGTKGTETASLPSGSGHQNADTLGQYYILHTGCVCPSGCLVGMEASHCAFLT